MTTNQTIDGVPGLRELLERLHAEHVSIAGPGFWATWKELRALLDAKPETVSGHHPACRAVDEYKPGECSHSCKPAAHTQGEPVAHTMKTVMQAYENAQSLHLPGTSNFCAVMAKHLNKYAEQPAPVAVLLPDRKQYVHQGLSHTDAKADGWNACLDEVTRLNAKSR